MDDFMRRPPADNHTVRRIFDGFELAEDDHQLRNILETAVRAMEEQSLAERELVCYASHGESDLEAVIGEALDEEDVLALVTSEMEVPADEEWLEAAARDDRSRAADDDGQDPGSARMAADYDAEFEDDAEETPDDEPNVDDDADEENALDDAYALRKRRARQAQVVQPPVRPQRRGPASRSKRGDRDKSGPKHR